MLLLILLKIQTWQLLWNLLFYFVVSPYHINKYTVCIGGEIKTEESWEQIILGICTAYTKNQPLKYSRSSLRAVVAFLCCFH